MQSLGVSPAPTKRRSQAERTAETTGAILDATIHLLAERGWAATSTTEVARLAGVSRGALLHHYPNRAELVGAAIEELYARLVREFEERLAELPDDAARADRALEMLWAVFQGPAFVATIEVGVAARHDPVLGPALAESADLLFERVEALWARHFPRLAEDARPIGVALLFDVLNGMATNRMIGSTRMAEQEGAVLAVLALLGESFASAAVDDSANPRASTRPPETRGVTP